MNPKTNQLTKKAAVAQCYALWLRIAQLCKDKRLADLDTKHTAAAQLGLDHYSAHCPCCQYDRQERGNCYCLEDCILPWPGDDCQHYSSPYTLWRQSPTYENAMSVANLALAQLQYRRTKKKKGARL